MEIIKRDGRLVPFDKGKIEKAVLAAFKSVDGSQDAGRAIASFIADDIEAEALVSDNALGIEEIQNLVEAKLMESDRKDVARAYITYRDKRTRARERDSELMRQIGAKLNATDVVNQNANVDERSFGGRMGEARSVVVKQYALDNLVSDRTRRHHDNNEIYLHDLDSYAAGMHNCVHGNTWVTIRKDGKVRTVRLETLANEIGLADGNIADLTGAQMSILSREGWTKLKNVSRRKTTDDEDLITIKCQTGLPLTVTGDHRLPIIRNGQEVVVRASEIAVGDELLEGADAFDITQDSESHINLADLIGADGLDLRIKDARPIKHYLAYKYGVNLLDECEFKDARPQLSHSSLRLSDLIELSKRYPLPFELWSRLLVKDNGSKHTYPLLIPKTESLAKLYAYIYCDGGIYQRDSASIWHLTFTNTNLALMRDFCDCYDDVFGYHPKIHEPSGNSPCYRLTDGSRIPCLLFADFAGARKTDAGNISLPDFVMHGTKGIKYAFLSAFIDTDGCITNESVLFTSAAKDTSEQLMLILKGLGYHPRINLSAKKGSKYHFGKSNRTGIRNYDCYNVAISRTEEYNDLLAHIDSLKTADRKLATANLAAVSPTRVRSIDTYQAEESVYDVETASHWFMANNYVSHNCLTVPIDDLLANGFITRQTDVRPAGSVKSAMQLVAVLFQLQSLCQFGGVAASHLDWSMVPYVRKSFSKHYRDGMRFLAHDAGYERDPDKSIVDATYTQEKEVYDYALAMTEEEVKQATEAMFHNLNLGRHDGNVMNIAA